MPAPSPRPTQTLGPLEVTTFTHPQGCRAYLVADPTSHQALALDVHLDLVEEVAAALASAGWTLPYVVDTHTHADHPSGAAPLAARFTSTRIAHRAAAHEGVTRHPTDGETLHLGDVPITVRHTPGHTPDHLVLVTDHALFSGDTLLIGNVARTDFLGGDAGQLFDSLHTLLPTLPPDTVVLPGHDYHGHLQSTVAQELRTNPWLQIEDRAEFIRALTANPPPRPANMDALLDLNRSGTEIPSTISAQEVARLVSTGGATSIIDVRTPPEVATEHIPGARPIPLDELRTRADEIRATPAPRLLLCRSGTRATLARTTLTDLGISGLTVITGGIQAYAAAGGSTVRAASETLPLERQVRVALGAVSLVGIVLGFLVHPAFFGLSSVVSAGLIYSGLTDWCGMALMLAKAPWNRAQTASSSTPAGPTAACAASTPAAACAATPPDASSSCAATPPQTGTP